MITKALEYEPENPNLYILRGLASQHSDKNQLAIEDYLLVHEMNNEEYRVYSFLGYN